MQKYEFAVTLKAFINGAQRHSDLVTQTNQTEATVYVSAGQHVAHVHYPAHSQIGALNLVTLMFQLPRVFLFLNVLHKFLLSAEHQTEMLPIV